jgi:hypothetical protein
VTRAVEKQRPRKKGKINKDSLELTANYNDRKSVAFGIGALPH